MEVDRTAQLQQRGSHLVAVAATPVSDAEVIELIDSIRDADSEAQDGLEAEGFWAQAEAAAAWRASLSAKQRAAASAHDAAADTAFDGVG